MEASLHRCEKAGFIVLGCKLELNWCKLLDSTTMFVHNGHILDSRCTFESKGVLQRHLIGNENGKTTKFENGTTTHMKMETTQSINRLHKEARGLLTYAEVPPLICDTKLERAKPSVNQPWSIPRPGPCLIAQKNAPFPRCIVSKLVSRMNFIIVDETPCVLGIHTLFNDCHL